MDETIKPGVKLLHAKNCVLNVTKISGCTGACNRGSKTYVIKLETTE